MAYRRITYQTANGPVTYEYPPQPYRDAEQRCRHSLAHGPLIREGNRWQARWGRHRYYNSTVSKLLSKGEAVERDGKVYLASRAPQ